MILFAYAIVHLLQTRGFRASITIQFGVRFRFRVGVGVRVRGSPMDSDGPSYECSAYKCRNDAPLCRVNERVRIRIRVRVGS